MTAQARRAGVGVVAHGLVLVVGVVLTVLVALDAREAAVVPGGVAVDAVPVALMGDGEQV